MSTMRPMIVCRRGAVAAGDPAAAAAGVRMLSEGGNAVDAAVAAAAALTVVHPQACGIGGDGFMLIGRAGGVVGINACGPAPAAADRAMYADGIPAHGPRCSTVPGVVDGWARALADHGTKTLAETLAPAIDYAEAGFPVHPRFIEWLGRNGGVLTKGGVGPSPFMPEGEIPALGTLIRQPDLADCLRAVAEGGRDAYYKGTVAKKLAAGIREAGGYFSEEDLAAYSCRVVEPLSVPYRDLTFYQIPPNSWGMLMLMQLRVLDGLDVAGMGHNSARLLHHLMETQRVCFASGRPHISDPDFSDIPVDRLLSEGHAAELRAGIDPSRAGGKTAGEPKGGTSYVAAMDDRGNAVSHILSVFHPFGSGFIPKGTGILMNNRLCGFTLETGHPNALAPGKRPAHTLSPAMAVKDGMPFISFGTPGAAAQTVTLTQLALNLVDFGMDVQAAIEAPRWAIDRDGNPMLEAEIGDDVRRALETMGHVFGSAEASRLLFGSAKIVMRDPDSGAIFAGADFRRYGYAIGL
ncbi:MAG: gamma-glutamyltransferase [Nitrospinota bacterium]|nr:gamma-glutamyltransferase [Nitrospinota bacterium]